MISTFIDICAVPSTPVQLIPNITFTSEQTRDVLATSTDTDVSKCAFVYILASFAVRSGNEAHVTFTAETTRQVQTVATLAQVTVHCTLIAV